MKDEMNTDLATRTLLESVGSLAARVDSLMARKDSATKPDDDRVTALHDDVRKLAAKLDDLIRRQNDDAHRRHRAAHHDDDAAETPEEPEEEAKDRDGEEIESMASDDDRADAPDDTAGAPSFPGQRTHASGTDRHHRADSVGPSDRILEVQHHWDRLAMAHGQRVRAPMMGESLHTYDRSCARMFQKHSPKFAGTDLNLMRPGPSWDVARQQIHDDGMKAAYSDKGTPSGLQRMVTRVDPYSGVKVHEFYGPVDAANGALAQFKQPPVAKTSLAALHRLVWDIQRAQGT
jgi:hypothetical protein